MIAAVCDSRSFQVEIWVGVLP